MPGENRKRQKKVTIRLAEEEYEAVLEKARTVEMTVPAFLRELALRQKVRSPLINKENAAELRKQVWAIGTNINQLTKLANSGKIQAMDLHLTNLELTRIGSLISALQQGKKKE